MKAIFSADVQGCSKLMGDDDEYMINTIMKPFFRPATYSDLVALLKKAGVSGDPQQLRLAVVWNVLQDHNGYIDVTSKATGTTFELFFPTTREEITGQDLSIPVKDLKGDGEKILVIDDEEGQKNKSRKMLQTLGSETKAVSSGEEAVEYLKENGAQVNLRNNEGITALNRAIHFPAIHYNSEGSAPVDTTAVVQALREFGGKTNETHPKQN